MRRVIGIGSLLVLLGGTLVASAEEPPAVEPKPEPTTAKVTKGHFEMTLSAPKLCGGGEVKAELALAPRAHYKFNKAFPTRVKLTPPDGVEVPKAKLKKGDAASVSDEGASFSIPYTCAATASGEVEAEAKFSVCDDKVCKIIKEKIAWSVTPAPVAAPAP